MMGWLVLPVYTGDSCLRFLHARRKQTVPEEEDGVQGEHRLYSSSFSFLQGAVSTPLSHRCVYHQHLLVAKVNKFTINTFVNKVREQHPSCQGLAGDSRAVRTWNLQGWSYSFFLVLTTLSCDGNELGRSNAGKQQEN